MKSPKNASPLSLSFLLFLVLTAFQLMSSDAQAQSSYFTSRGCTSCHAAPVVATCNGCHAHGAHASSTKNTINVTGATNKTSYAPGETVSVTIAGGYRNGWVRATLYNQSGAEIARSTGTASGMSSSATLPTVLSAPAPTTPGTYTWKVSWYGNINDTSSAAFGTGWKVDPNNPNHGEEIVSTNSFTVAAASTADTTKPVVGTFTLPATATSLSVPITALTATDNVAVTGYLVTTSATAPAATAAGWSVAAPASVTAPAAGTVTFYAWAKDAAGNVSLAKTAAVTITIATADTTKPVVGTFTLPATATSLSVPVTALTATDNVAVTGYLVTTSATAPAATAAGWTATAPASVTAVAGSNTFYAWAKDAAGNVSLAKTASVIVTLPPAADTTNPVVGTFTLPATATSLSVPVTALTATDNVAVTGYLVTTSATAPAATAAGWSVAAPASVTAPAAGSVTFYAWAKDAAGNVSLAKTASVTVTLPPAADTTNPVISAFTLPADSTSLTLSVTAFAATDNVGITGYLVTTSAAAPAATAAGWSATAPASVTAPAAGNVTFYAWAKDAAGNVSAAATAAVTITLPGASDTSAPAITSFVLPASAKSRTVTVTAFAANDDTAVTGYLVTTSATPPTAAAAGWRATPPASVTAPATGSVTFYAWAKDAAGNVSVSTSADVTITTSADIMKPTLIISTLANKSATSDPVLNVSGSTKDARSGIQSVTVNGQPVTLNDDGTFSYAVTLVEGPNTVTVVATDNAGNQRTKARSITYDPVAPAISIASPTDNSLTGRAFLTIKGAVDEKARVTVAVNAKQPHLANRIGTAFSGVVYLEPGLNTVTVTAVDLAGNSSSVKRTITFDNNKPTLAVIDPVQDAVITQPQLTLKGTVSDTMSDVTVTVTVDGQSYTPEIVNGEFQQTVTVAAEGQHAIVVIATDALGHKQKAFRNVIYRPDAAANTAP
jgi:hypothetical protein